MITKTSYIYPRTLLVRMQLRRILTCYNFDPGYSHYHRRGRRGRRRSGNNEEEKGRGAGFRF